MSVIVLVLVLVLVLVITKCSVHGSCCGVTPHGRGVRDEWSK